MSHFILWTGKLLSKLILLCLFSNACPTQPYNLVPWATKQSIAASIKQLRLVAPDRDVTKGFNSCETESLYVAPVPTAVQNGVNTKALVHLNLGTVADPIDNVVEASGILYLSHALAEGASIGGDFSSGCLYMSGGSLYVGLNDGRDGITFKYVRTACNGTTTNGFIGDIAIDNNGTPLQHSSLIDGAGGIQIVLIDPE